MDHIAAAITLLGVDSLNQHSTTARLVQHLYMQSSSSHDRLLQSPASWMLARAAAPAIIPAAANRPTPAQLPPMNAVDAGPPTMLPPLLRLLLLLQLNAAGQLYNLNSKYGNKQDLQELVAAINEKGMLPVADIVINHRWVTGVCGGADAPRCMFVNVSGCINEIDMLPVETSSRPQVRSAVVVVVVGNVWSCLPKPCLT